MESPSHLDKQTFEGLHETEVHDRRLKSGANILDEEDKRQLLVVLSGIVREPMFLLLLIAGFVYFMLNQLQEGFALLIALLLVSGISIFQEYRSRNAVAALKKLSATKAKVIRDGLLKEIPAEDIVCGDFLVVKEGELVAADGLLRQANDLFLNESILTGESFPVHKKAQGQDHAYKGTLVSSGSAVIEVTAVGKGTQFGKIGLQLASIAVPRTPLQLQIASFIRKMAIAGVIAFILVFVLQYVRSSDWVLALLAALTLAMSILPEEIPVAFSTFQALGAFRLLAEKIIVKHPQYVETLGSATVICADKTGTITQNLMQIAMVYDARSQQSYESANFSAIPEELIAYAMWASESAPFDPMEKAIHDLYEKLSHLDVRGNSRQIHEYPLSGSPPFMTHVFLTASGDQIIASKGAPESILRNSKVSEEEKNKILSKAVAFAGLGYRVLGVGKGNWQGEQWPLSQEEIRFEFLGLIAFLDPPKENIISTLLAFKNAGIDFKMITGDYPETSVAIAERIGIDHGLKVLTGKEVMEKNDKELQDECKKTSIFARMFPEAKLRVIDALKQQGEVVAMTGDGVNDAPALKASHIGIAMGQRGSEAAKGAASLILVDDDLGHMVQAIAQGRKIYDNLKKAVRYIISIHIPIILIVLLPLLLGWSFTSVFSPIHVIFLELIMGPTCSIIYENEPMEAGTMNRPPRALLATFLTLPQLVWSMLQGLGITLGCLSIGYYFIKINSSHEIIRSMIFITLLISNVFLTWINRSFRYSIFTTWRYRNHLLGWTTLLSLAIITSILTVPFLQNIFEISILSFSQLIWCIIIAGIGTLWIEVLKGMKSIKMD